MLMHVTVIFPVNGDCFIYTPSKMIPESPDSDYLRPPARQSAQFSVKMIFFIKIVEYSPTEITTASHRSLSPALTKTSFPGSMSSSSWSMILIFGTTPVMLSSLYSNNTCV